MEDDEDGMVRVVVVRLELAQYAIVLKRTKAAARVLVAFIARGGHDDDL